MHTKRTSRSFVPLIGLLTVSLAACSGDEPYRLASRTSAAAVNAGGVTVDVVATGSWQGGFNGAVRLIDVSFPSPITSFAVVFQLSGAASVQGTGWNGDVSAADGSGNRTATSPSWLQFNPIQQGQTWDVGFSGGGTLSGSTIVSVMINGQSIPIDDGGDDDGGGDDGGDDGGDGGDDGGGDGGDDGGGDGGGPDAVFRVSPQGRITKDGQVFPVHCGSWFGLEGRHEPSSDPTNPSGAPMEQYIGNTFWANGGSGTGRTIQQTMAEIAAAGINVVRIPVVPQTLTGIDPQGMNPFLKNHSSVRVANSRLALEQLITLADQNNIEVLLDMHSCSNYVGWRKGRLDARPPYSDRDRDNYDFKRENYSCAATGNPPSVTTIHPYNQTLWLNDLRTLAGLGQELGVDNIIGIDIFNEPWDYTWAEWKALTEAAYEAINEVNPNTLLFVQGISATAGNQDGSPTTITQTPHGDVATNPNWGENLFEAGANPPDMPRERLVFSPHTYGPSVFVQKMFMDPAQPQCAGLEGDAAGDANCNIVIPTALLRDGWEEHFGYLRDLGYAVVVGEFGGNLDWPLGQASIRDRDRWNHITPGVDADWQNDFVDYMVEPGHRRLLLVDQSRVWRYRRLVRPRLRPHLQHVRLG